MTASAPSEAQTAFEQKPGAKRFNLRHALAQARRYGLSAFGPLSVSGAHFLATLVLLHWLSDQAFGQYSFALVVSGLCISLTNGLLSAPVSSIAHTAAADQRAELHTYFKSSLLLGVVLSLAMFAIMLASNAPMLPAALFGLYGGTMSLRIFARVHEYALGRIRNVVLSDTVYSATILLGVVALSFATGVTLLSASLVMALGAALALLPFGLSLFRAFVEAVRVGSVRGYWRIWQDITRWSMLGVVTTEVTINAHAYLVTFIAGAGAFAPIAVGALFMRPFTLVISALPDQERPAMARHIAKGDPGRAAGIANEYRLVLCALWLATLALTVAVIVWFPGLLIRHSYSRPAILEAVVLWSLISAVRGYRGPDAVLLQAAREFKSLANASLRSSGISLVATLALLLLLGPVASLGGILLGDVVMLFIIVAGVRTWRAHTTSAPVPEPV